MRLPEKHLHAILHANIYIIEKHLHAILHANIYIDSFFFKFIMNQ